MSNVGAPGPILCMKGLYNPLLTTSIGFVAGLIFLRSLDNSAEEDKGEGYRGHKSFKKQRDKTIWGSNPKKF